LSAHFAKSDSKYFDFGEGGLFGRVTPAGRSDGRPGSHHGWAFGGFGGGARGGGNDPFAAAAAACFAYSAKREEPSKERNDAPNDASKRVSHGIAGGLASDALPYSFNEMKAMDPKIATKFLYRVDTSQLQRQQSSLRRSPRRFAQVARKE